MVDIRHLEFTWAIKVKVSTVLTACYGPGSKFTSVQFSSVAQSCPTLCDPMNCSTLGLPIHQQLLESTQTHVYQVGDAIQPSHPLSSPFPPAPSPSNEHPGLISFRMDCLFLLAVQGTLKSLVQHHSAKASTLPDSAFFIVQLSHPYMTTGKTT